MTRKRTWKVLSWPLLCGRAPDGELELACNKCGHEATLPTLGSSGDLVVASVGMHLIFDRAGHVPPPEFMPEAVQCRNCRTVWSGAKEVSSVD